MSTVTARGPRLLEACAASYDEHLSRLGPVPSLTPAALVAEVEAAGLVGRGGADFPSARKLTAVAGGRRAVVVANGAEGEPASSKDRMLLAAAPHLVLDGLQAAAVAVGAAGAYMYAPQDLLDDVVGPALAERRDAVAVRCVGAPDTFVSGQESAVVQAIMTGRAVPSSAWPRVVDHGVDGRRTLVHNVETLAHLALVVRYGARWFRGVGAPSEPGTRLATVSGSVARPGVYEFGGGVSLGEIVDTAGGAGEPLRALLIGGYHGGWVPWNASTADLPWTRDALRRFEAAPGAGVVIALPVRACGVRVTAELTAYLAGQSAAQCGPCRFGLPAVAAQFARLAAAPQPAAAVRELQRLVGLVDGRGACKHPDGTARLVRSALRTFADEVAAHQRGRCTADPWWPR